MTCEYRPEVERWGVQEMVLTLSGSEAAEKGIRAVFQNGDETVAVDGFQDGEGRWLVRFMPQEEGRYTFRVAVGDETASGAFQVIPATGNNHGPVRVSEKYHFAYADGTRYIPVGTTCYVWHLQTPEIFEQTLQTLAASPFNKIRFCVFPKHYDYNHREPFAYPFRRGEDGQWDTEKPNPAYFRHLEKAVMRLGELGIEADVILLHPYDRWGLSTMTRAQTLAYLKYVTQRLCAYRNVWWSMANEYDLMGAHTVEDWEAYAAEVQQSDPYHHLQSIHNCGPFYDHSRPWVTHCCMQRQDVYRTTEYVDQWRREYGKPVIVDEMGYEGDIQHGWGNLTGEEIVRRFWEATVRGGYGGHGETFLNERDILWWSHGDVLHGESPERLRFLRNFLSELPGALRPVQRSWDEVCATLEGADDDAAPLYLYYYSFMRPGFRDYQLPEGKKYEIEVLDTWNMKREKQGVFSGKVRVKLPGKSYVAVCMRQVAE